MTRAAERLVIAGYAGHQRRPDGCWYDLVAQGLGEAAVAAPAFWDEAAVVLRYGEGLTADGGDEGELAASSPDLPDWLMRPRSRRRRPPNACGPRTGAGRADQGADQGTTSRVARASPPMRCCKVARRRARPARARRPLPGSTRTGARCRRPAASRSPTRSWRSSIRPRSCSCSVPARVERSRLRGS